MISKQAKGEVVKKISNDLQTYSTVAIASLEGLSSDKYSKIKKKISSDVKFDMGRNTLMLKALNSSDSAKGLSPEVKGSSAVLLTNLNAFKLFKLLKQNKSKAGAKPGQVAPDDIVVPAGETNLTPGPVLTELKNVKIDAKIQGPKVVIAKDSTVVKKGEVISDKVAGILSKLGIQPMEVGLNVVAVSENGFIYKKDVLEKDDSYYIPLLQVASQYALNLSVNASIFNKESVCVLVGKGGSEAKSLAAVLNYAVN